MSTATVVGLETATKACTKCREDLPVTDFHRDRSRSDGLCAKCKDCTRAHHRDYNARSERVAKAAEHRAANRDVLAAKSRAWYAENADRRKERQRVWYAENTDRALEYRRAYYAEHAVRIKAYNRARYQPIPPGADRPLLGASWAAQYRFRALRYGFEPVVEEFTKADVVELYGDACHYCPDGAFEQLDHALPVSRGGRHTLENVRPSCRRDNGAKSALTEDEYEARKAGLL